ncbi:HEAT repeat domain-containing protein [Algoriphagus formosus]|uniref:HEAT repeat domain-containing protein n=1 Tax=Algoriphagus formosus TaxID=2007308 RepID=UPI000C292D71|nr:HEAT repeat domain-containing protein [Algoriphagus formosus]
MLKKIPALLALILFFQIASAQSLDTLFKSKEDLLLDLSKQREVNSLEFQFFLPDSILNQEWINSSDLNLQAVNGGFLTKTFDDWSKYDSLQGIFPQANSIFLLYGEPTNYEGVISYLNTLYATGDFLPVSLQEESNESLILAAVKSIYEPYDTLSSWLVFDWKLIWVLVILSLFLILALGLILALVIFKARRNQREELRKAYDKDIIDPLTTILFTQSLEELKEMKPEELKEIFPAQLFPKPLFKEVLIERIIGLNKKMKGEFKGKLKELYKKLDLIKITEKNLKSKKWSYVTTGLVQVNEMDLSELLPEVKKHTNSKNFHVRSSAGATLLNLSQEADLSFLKNQDYPLSDWQQMNYLRIIKYVHPTKKLMIHELFQSPNESVRIFAIKLVAFLGRFDLIEQIKILVPSAQNSEKIEILQTYLTLGAHMEAEFINANITSEDEDVQKMAIKVAGKIGDEISEKILFQLLEETSDRGIRLLILESLKELNEVAFESYIQEHSNPENLQMREQLLDPLLQNV